MVFPVWGCLKIGKGPHVIMIKRLSPGQDSANAFEHGQCVLAKIVTVSGGRRL